MSNLLTELTLNYEFLNNDPVEMGIHFGHNVLNYVSDSYDNIRQSSEVSSISRKFSRFIDSQRKTFIKPAQIETKRQIETYSLPIVKRNVNELREKVYYQKRTPVLPARELSFSIDSSRFKIPQRVAPQPRQIIGQI